MYQTRVFIPLVSQFPLSIMQSQSTSILQQLGELALLGLQVGVSTNMLLLDVDIRDGSLAIDLLERILDRGSIIYHPS
jgi:hypothetical protein